MEEAHHDHHNQYLTWVQKRKEMILMNSSINGSSPSSSWEERAFSEDLHAAEAVAAAGSLGGGCVWPPRSYTCSFCMREFKSAQALGGHMNIHRRDRARLKQFCLIPSPTLHTSTSHDHNDHMISRHDHHIINPDHHDHQYSLKLDPVKYSSPSSGTNIITSSTASRYVSTNYGNSRVSAEDQPPNFVTNSAVETDLHVGLNSVVGRNNRTSSSSSPTGRRFCGDQYHHQHETTDNYYKRPKLMSFFLKPCRLESHKVIHDEVLVTELATGTCMDENLDLELRLGEPPK